MSLQRDFVLRSCRNQMTCEFWRRKSDDRLTSVSLYVSSILHTIWSLQTQKIYLPCSALLMAKPLRFSPLSKIVSRWVPPPFLP
ncbi:unnamed protein product [Brassica oleracea var. botrytis]